MDLFELAVARKLSGGGGGGGGFGTRTITITSPTHSPTFYGNGDNYLVNGMLVDDDGYHYAYTLEAPMSNKAFEILMLNPDAVLSLESELPMSGTGAVSFVSIGGMYYADISGDCTITITA